MWLVAALVLVCKVWILSGTAYLVGWQGWSPWWLAFALLASGEFSVKHSSKVKEE